VNVLPLLESEPRRFSLPVAAAAGAAVGFYSPASFRLALFAVSIFLASFGQILGSQRQLADAKPDRAVYLRRLQALALALGMAAGLAISAIDAGRSATISTEAPSIQDASSEQPRLSPVWAEGRLSSDSTPAKNGFRSYPLAVERLGLSGKGVSAELSYPGGRGGELRVLARGGREVDSGSLIRVQGRFAGPSAPMAARGPEPSAAKPVSATALSGTAALFARPGDILVLDRGSALTRARSSAREACRRALGRIGTRSAGLYQALILGVRDSLAPDEAEAFKSAGCSHILALSGEHLSVLAVLAVAALRSLIGPVRARLGGAIVAGLFMWIAGPGPSLLRAVIMAWIGAAALALDRPQGQLGALGLAFLVMLPLDPAGARSLSFTLSFLAVWGLAVLGPRFSFLLGGVLPPTLRDSASASMAAQAAVSPLLALGFGYLQFAGIPASMAAGPLVTAMMWWGMGTGLVCSLLPCALPAVLPLSDFLYDLLLGVMRAAASCPQLPLPSIPVRLAASAAVAALAALVYARPYAEYRAAGRKRFLARLRFAPGPAGPPPGGGPRHVQALRPELPR
jgi:ComEC/Rec2-related protein